MRTGALQALAFQPSNPDSCNSSHRHCYVDAMKPPTAIIAEDELVNVNAIADVQRISEATCA